MNDAQAGAVVTQNRVFSPQSLLDVPFLSWHFCGCCWSFTFSGKFSWRTGWPVGECFTTIFSLGRFPFFSSKYNKKPVNKSQKSDLSLKYEPWHRRAFDSEATSHLWRLEVCSTSSSRRSLNAYKNRVYLSTVRTAYLLSWRLNSESFFRNLLVSFLPVWTEVFHRVRQNTNVSIPISFSL